MNKKFIIALIISFLVLLAGVTGLYYYNYQKINNSIIVEINTEHMLSEYLTSLKNDKKIDTSKIGVYEENVEFKYFNKLININVIDNTPPEILNVKDINVMVNDKVDLLKNIKVIDNSNEDIIPVIEGDYDLSKTGKYNLKVTATDSSGNKTEKEFILNVIKKSIANNYYIKVNKNNNVVMVYNDNQLIKTFICSCGDYTPLGIFNTGSKHEVLYLVDGTYGHYTMQITGSIWFHSVPYYSKPTSSNPHWDNIEYDEYNKLGTLASLGCVRLQVIDAKWIYDNIPKNTKVEIYEGDLPSDVIKPSFTKIDTNSEYKGWDPTDPDTLNPWNK